jgi:ABC-type transport system substrate-binding protein
MNAKRLSQILLFSILASVAACAAPTPPPPQVVTEVVERVVTQVVTQIVAGTSEVQIIEVTATAPATDAPVVYEEQAAEQRLRLFGGNGVPGSCGFGWDWVGMRLVFYPLINVTDDASAIAPGLAKTWEPNDDFTTWTFHIDPNAVWSDGTPVTAGQIKRSLEFRYMPEQQCSWGGAHLMLGGLVGEADVWENGTPGVAPDIAGLTAPNDATLVFEFDSPRPQVLTRLFHYVMYIFKPEPVFEDPDPANFAETMIGAGPFIVQERNIEAVSALLVQNPNWWGEVKPIIQEIEFVPMVDDPTSRLLAYQAGEVDWLFFQPDLWDQIKDTSTAQDLHSEGGPAWWMFVIKSRKPPFDDINVRRAFIHAMDYDAIVASLLNNTLEKPDFQLLSEPFPCFQEKRPWTFDPELARQELAQSKYGADLENFPPIYIRYGAHNILAGKMIQIIQQQWQTNLGIGVNLFAQAVPDADMEEKTQIVRVSDGFSDLDVGRYLSDYGALDGPVICGGEGTEICASLSPESDELRAEYAAADEAIARVNAMSPSDPEFCQAVNEAEDLINEDFHYIPLYSTFNYHLIQPWVKNIIPGGATQWSHLAGLETIGYIADH